MSDGTLGDLVIALGFDPAGLDAGASQIEQRLEQTGTRLYFLGSRISAAFSVPLGAAVGLISEFGLQFDQAMTEALAITSNVSPQIRTQMEQTARSIADTTKFSATEAAKAYYDLLSAGLDVSQSMAALPQVAKFAQAGLMELSEAGELLAGSTTALGLKTNDATTTLANMSRVSDVLTAVNNRALGTVKDFADALSNRGAQAMRMYNVPLEEGVAVLGAFADQNIKGRQAGQLLYMMLRDLTGAAVKHSEAWKEAGIQVFDANGNLLNLATIIDNLTNKFGPMNVEARRAELQFLGLTARSQVAINALVGMGSTVRDLQGFLQNAGGTTEQVAEKQMQSLSNQLTQLKNQFANVAIQIFQSFVPVIQDTLLPLVRDALTLFQSLASWLDTLTEGQKKWLAVIVGVGIALGPVIMATGGVVLAVRAAWEGVTLLTGGLAMLTGAYQKATIAALENAGATQVLARAITADLTVSQMKSIQNSELVATKFVKSAEAAGIAKGAFQSWDAIPSLFSRVSGAVAEFSSSWLGIGAAIAAGLVLIKEMTGSWEGVFDALNALTFGSLAPFRDMLSGTGGVISEITNYALELAKALGGALLGAVYIIKAGWQDLAIIGHDLNATFEDFKTLMAPLTDAIGLLKDGVVAANTAMREWVPGFASVEDWVGDKIKTAYQKAKDALHDWIKEGETWFDVFVDQGVPKINTYSDAYARMLERFKSVQMWVQNNQPQPYMPPVNPEAYLNTYGGGSSGRGAGTGPDGGASAGKSRKVKEAPEVKQLTTARGLELLQQMLFKSGDPEHASTMAKLFGEMEKIEFGGNSTSLASLGFKLTPSELKGELPNENILGALVSGLRNMSQIGGASSGTVSGIGKLLANLQMAQKVQSQLNKNYPALAMSGGAQWGIGSAMFTGSTANRVEAGVAAAGQVAQGAMGIWEATGSHASAWGNAGAGALAGAEAGAAFGPYGIAIGAAAGLIVGLIRGKPEWAKAADEVGKDFGVKISDGLAKAIAKDADEMFGGSRQAASIYNLNKIIQEAGGVTSQNFSQLADRMRDVFVMVGNGTFTAAQGAKVLDDNWNDFVKTGTDGLGFLNSKLTDMIGLNDQFGTKSQAITQYVGQQMATVAQGFNAIAAGGMKPLNDLMDEINQAQSSMSGGLFGNANDSGKDAKYVVGLAQQIADLQAKIADLQSKGGSLTASQAQNLKNYQDKLKDLQSEYGNLDKSQQQWGDDLQKKLQNGQTEFDRLGRLANVAFGAAIAGGQSFLQALNSIGPGLDQLIQAAQNFGFTQSDAFGQLAAIRAFTQANQDLVGELDGINQMLTGLQNTGRLTQSTMDDLGAEAVSVFQRMKDGGLDDNSALLLMQPTLQTLWEETHTFGMKVDDATQSLLDMAEKDGLVGETHKTVNEQIVDGLTTINSTLKDLVTVLTGGVSGAFDSLGRNANTVIGRITDGINRIPTNIHIGVRATVEEEATSGNEPAMASGGIVMRPTRALVGEGGQPEAVIPLDRLQRMMNINATGGDTTVVLQVDGREIARAALRNMPQELRRNGLFT